MLPLVIPKREFWDEVNERVIFSPATSLKLEHSLISISKWESKWHVPFFDTEKTNEQVIDYLKCMTLNENVDPRVYECLTMDELNKINAYIADPMTATTINSKDKSNRTNERITSELIYYWMIAYNIPVVFEKWHINRLIMLIRVCSEKNKPPKKMSSAEIMRQNSAINAARRARLHTKG